MSERVGKWTATDLALLRSAYADPRKPLGLTTLARELGRLPSNVSRKARSLGLTNPSRVQSRDRVAEGQARSALWAKRGHPRGALGLKHSSQTKARISERSKAAWANPTSAHRTEARNQKVSDGVHRSRVNQRPANPYSRCAGGKRQDLGGRYFRSAWEADFARFLTFEVERGFVRSWAYETTTFTFPRPRTVRSYTPDFRVTLSDGRTLWCEVKGWMDERSRERLALMRQFFPEEIVELVDEAWFRRAWTSGLPALIDGWESKRVGRRRP